MAIPTDVPTLYAWYKAGSLSLNEGDQIPSWLDSSGNGRTMTGATALTIKPVYRANQIAGYPAVELNGTNQDYFTNDAFGWLANLASCTLFIVWKGTSASTGGIITSLGGNGSECLFQKSATQIGRRWSSTTTTYEALATFNLAEWHYACGFQSGTSQIGVSVDGGSETTTALGGSRSAAVTTDGRIGQDGGAYSAGRIAEAIIYSSALSAGDKTLVNNYLRDKYFAAAPGQQEQVRDALSRRLWLLRRPTGLFEVTVPLWMLDADILDRIAVEARVGPAPAAAGWGGKKWQRRAFSIQRISDVNPATNTVKLQLLDRRPLDVLFWDASRTDKRNSSARQDGVARVSKGNGWTFSRLSKAWVANPADPTSIVECAQTERAINQTGEYFEEARTNEITRSSFASGTTGLTLAGTGTNGSAIAVETTEILFGTETTPNSLRFTAGNPHAAELRATFPATASWATTSCRVSIDHRTESAQGFYWRLQRSGDSYWWNDTTPGWQAGTVDNATAASTARNPANRTISKAITMDATSRTLTLSVFLQSGGTASRISYLYHVQIEKGDYPTSRIVTDGSAGTRVATDLTHAVTTAAKIIDPELGTFFCEVTPDWSSADVGATGFSLWRWSDSSVDNLTVYYSSGVWTFSRKVGSVFYTATLTQAVTRGVTYKVAARWTGGEGELGLAAYSLTVFVDGVAGSTTSSGAAGAFTSGKLLYRGANSAAATYFGGAIRSVMIFPYALTDEEIARLP